MTARNLAIWLLGALLVYAGSKLLGAFDVSFVRYVAGTAMLVIAGSLHSRLER